MKFYVPNEMKGRIAIITRDGGRIVCHASYAVVDGAAVKDILAGIRLDHASLQTEVDGVASGDYAEKLWRALSALIEQKALPVALPVFARQVTATYGAGGYVYDMTGQLKAPHKIPKLRFHQFIKEYGLDHRVLRPGGVSTSSVDDACSVKNEPVRSVKIMDDGLHLVHQLKQILNLKSSKGNQV